VPEAAANGGDQSNACARGAAGGAAARWRLSRRNAEHPVRARCRRAPDCANTGPIIRRSDRRRGPASIAIQRSPRRQTCPSVGGRAGRRGASLRCGAAGLLCLPRAPPRAARELPRLDSPSLAQTASQVCLNLSSKMTMAEESLGKEMSADDTQAGMSVIKAGDRSCHAPELALGLACFTPACPRPFRQHSHWR